MIELFLIAAWVWLIVTGVRNQRKTDRYDNPYARLREDPRHDGIEW